MGKFYRGGDRRHDLGRRLKAERRRAVEGTGPAERRIRAERRSGADRRASAERRIARSHLYNNPLGSPPGD